MKFHPRDLIHPDDLKRDREKFVDLLQTGIPFTTEVRYFHKQGHSVWARLTRSIVRKSDGEIDFGVIIVQNIQDYKQTIPYVQTVKAPLSQLADSASFGILLGLHDGTIQYANPALREMLGDSIDPFILQQQNGTIKGPIQ